MTDEYYETGLLKGKRHRYYQNLEWGMKPYPKQQEVVDYLWGHRRNPDGELYRFFLAIFGRQSGKSFLARYVALRRAIEYGHRVLWIAPTSINVREHWTELKETVIQSGIPVKSIREQGKEILFHGSGFIRMRSALEGHGLRGGTIDLVIMDEAAFYRNGRDTFYGIILPMITASRGQILFTTTPNGRNYVWELYTQGIDPEDRLHIAWHMKSADSPYQDKKLLRQLKRSMPEMQWREEFEAEFLADAGGVFANVERASVVPLQDEPEEYARYTMGVDWGDVEDYTTVTIVNKDTRQQVFGDRFTGIGTKFQLDRVLNIIYRWQPEDVYVERNGMGHTYYKLLVETIKGAIPLDEFMAQIAEEREPTMKWWDVRDSEKISKHGNINIHGVHVDNKLKREMVEGTAADIEYGRMELLAGCEYAIVQQAEMSTFTRKRTANGVTVTYSAADDNHDDTVSALILAWKGLPKPEKLSMFTELETKDDFKNPFREKAKQRIVKRRK